jgi:thiol:disulfide interchange protein DsbD
MRLIVFLVALRTADLVSWTITSQPTARGGATEVVLRATIAPGWRLYALGSPVGRPLALDVGALPAGVEARAPEQSRPRDGYDEAFETAYTYFVERAEVRLPLRVGARAARGRHIVAGTLHYAICDDSICLPPASTPFRTRLTVR